MHPEANAKADHRAITRLTKMRVVISISTQDGSAALDENSFWRGRILCRELKRSMQPQKKWTRPISALIGAWIRSRQKLPYSSSDKASAEEQKR
jgi:hypothetical protein